MPTPSPAPKAPPANNVPDILQPNKYLEIVRAMQKLLTQAQLRGLAQMLQERLVEFDREELSLLDTEFSYLLRMSLAFALLKLKEHAATQAVLASLPEQNFASKFLAATCVYQRNNAGNKKAALIELYKLQRELDQELN